MWISFKGPIPEGYEINHIDHNKYNNCIDNLECISHRDNIKYTYSKSKHSNQQGVLCLHNNKIYRNAKEASKDIFGVESNCRHSIQNVCRGIKNNFRGFHFEYVELN